MKVTITSSGAKNDEYDMKMNTSQRKGIGEEKEPRLEYRFQCFWKEVEETSFR